ncbi:unnamed protein product [Vitrella brassicaformis CCMP3155]|uniref:Uncharacterized protein n=1 Tax=Vitrella brassicaformis (strain CCMP3155) TaxID=1169540 RepID=A0A0G4FXU1_VITBC|nr:unnamed protein product [Vitrella brassicaformis CCMP3155]|eukprot:CEM20244.1 unnamed protein product [Vitrella brassicaformis CCMP3155]
MVRFVMMSTVALLAIAVVVAGSPADSVKAAPNGLRSLRDKAIQDKSGVSVKADEDFKQPGLRRLGPFGIAVPEVEDFGDLVDAAETIKNVAENTPPAHEIVDDYYHTRHTIGTGNKHGHDLGDEGERLGERYGSAAGAAVGMAATGSWAGANKGEQIGREHGPRIGRGFGEAASMVGRRGKALGKAVEKNATSKVRDAFGFR